MKGLFPKVKDVTEMALKVPVKKCLGGCGKGYVPTKLSPNMCIPCFNRRVDEKMKELKERKK